MIVADHEGEFVKARALNETIASLPEDATVVALDADSQTWIATLLGAIREARLADGAVYPHSRYLYLNPETTREILLGERSSYGVTEDLAEDVGVGVGNAVVFSRKTWEIACGFDERFVGWGGDDSVFAFCAGLAGPQRRIPGDVVHLWHPRPPSSIPGAPGYTKQFAIVAAFRDAAAVGPDAVRALIAAR